MRIAVNTRFLISGKMEGLGWHNYELCRQLVQQYPEHDFLFFFDRSFSRDFLFGPNVRGLVLPPPARHPLLWYLWFEWTVPLFLKRYRADVFLSPDGYCSLRATTPTLMITHDIAHVHDPDQVPPLVRRYYEYFVPRYLERADRVITVSDYVRKDILAHYPVDPKKISVAYNGIRGSFAPLAADEIAAVREKYAGGKPYFFYLGAVHPRKNLARLIAAFDRFKSRSASPVQLLIGGRMAWHTEAIERAYGAAAWKKDIHFLGYVSETELPRLLGAALALTYVSLSEGFGLPVLEAMHAEVPVITSDRTSLPEIAGPAALLADPTSEASIARAMDRIWTDAELRSALVQQGRERRTAFSWATTARLVFEKLLEIA